MNPEDQAGYKVEGYGRKNDGYGGPYHETAELDPTVQFANAGDAKKQAKWAKDLKVLQKVKKGK